MPYFANPVSELDVAFGESGSPTYTPGNTKDYAHPATPAQAHPVIRLGSPPLAEQFPFLASPHPQPVFFRLPVTPPQDVARQAAALARHGTIFLVTWGPPSSSSAVLSQQPETIFLKAFQVVSVSFDRSTFLGYSGLSPYQSTCSGILVLVGSRRCSVALGVAGPSLEVAPRFEGLWVAGQTRL